MILVIDNYDSFVHNLARHMELAGWDCRVARNDAINVEVARNMNPEAIVMSPGPYGPSQAGICVDIIRRLGPFIPILGVCLGHQCIAEAYGAKVTRAARPVHGKASAIHHDGDPLFANIPNVFNGGRYHSLIVSALDDAPLAVTAKTAEGEIMAIRHQTFPVYGLQFHPESILTDHGMTILKNFSALALAWNGRWRRAA